MENQSCSTCQFWKQRDVQYNDDGSLRYQDRQMVCKRYPPVVKHDNENLPRDYYSFPVIMGHQWCGEYQPKEPQTINDAAVQIARQVLLGDTTAANALIDNLQEARDE